MKHVYNRLSLESHVFDIVCDDDVHASIMRIKNSHSAESFCTIILVWWVEWHSCGKSAPNIFIMFISCVICHAINGFGSFYLHTLTTLNRFKWNNNRWHAYACVVVRCSSIRCCCRCCFFLSSLFNFWCIDKI